MVALGHPRAAGAYRRRRRCSALAALAALACAGQALAAQTASAATIRVTPSAVSAGKAFTVSGQGFGARTTVIVQIGPPQSDDLSRLGSVRTDARGRFRLRSTTSRRATPGTYVVLACRTSCAVKATARVKIRRAAAPSTRETACGTVRAVSGETLRITARGTACSSARGVISAYYSRGRAGECEGGACPLRVRGYSCATRTFAAQQASGISTTCTRAGRVIRTRTR